MKTVKADGLELLVVAPSEEVLAEAREVCHAAIAEAEASGEPTPDIAWATAGWEGDRKREAFLLHKCVFHARTGAPYFKNMEAVEEHPYSQPVYEAFQALSPYLDDGR